MGCNKGALFWCKGYDFSQGWHWCDWSDGKWKTNGLHYKCLDNKALVRFSCKDGKSGTTKSSGGGGAVFGKAKDSGQITTCTEGKLIGSGTVTCKGPKVTWGKHIGVPHKHSGNNYNRYCQSMGYSGFLGGSDKYGTVKCDKGALFGCSGYDFSGWHWCDWQDGRWKNNGVHYACKANTALISISCSGGQSGTTKGHVNQAKDPSSVRVIVNDKDSGQVTTCENGKEHVGSVVRCSGPRVTWGSHTGVPHQQSSNDYNKYCQSLGFGSFVTGSDKYGTVRCNKGALFWCKGYDFSQGYHWCDWSDGKWKTSGLHYKCLDDKAWYNSHARTVNPAPPRSQASFSARPRTLGRPPCA